MENVKYDDICTSLECCRHNECSKCFYKGSSDCIINLMEDAGRTIKKLQALTDRLRIANTNSYGSGYSIGYIKGVKEFAERLERVISISAAQKPYFNNLIKEMVGDDNA